MRFFLLYYSGAGNTQLVASFVARELRRMGHSVTTKFARLGAELPQLNHFDGLIVGTPVYAYAPPETLMAVVSSLPKLDGKPAFTFMTKGLISGNAPVFLQEALQSKGITVIGHEEIMMADTLFILTSPKNSLMEKLMLLPNLLAIRKIKALPRKILRAFEVGKEVRLRRKLYAFATNFIAGWFHDFVRSRTGYFYADARCDLCSACVGLCPNGNIRIADGRVLFGDDCEFCVRCVHRCPQEAIQVDRYIQKAGRYVPQKDKYLKELLK